MFDTFEGFDERDVDLEKNKSDNYIVSSRFYENPNTFIYESIEKIRADMYHPENCILKQGWFPDTFDNSEDELKNEKFFFVNIDTDLYAPTKAGFEKFYPLMVKGGLIMSHDYQGYYDGVMQAVDEFCAENDICPVTVGDCQSIVIVKN
jgi:hypothetical protein